MDFNAPPILPSIFATPILPSIFATHHHGFDLEFSKSIIDLLHPDACKRADYLHMLVEFENHATKLMTLPLYEQQTLVRVLSEIQHPSAIKLWAIIFGVACESSVAGDLFLHLLQPPNFPEDAWQQLPSLGNSFLYKISKNIVFQGFSPRIVQGEWGALRHSVACAIIEAGHMTLGIDGPPTIAALFPMDTIRPRVERALQDLETLRNCNGDSINEIIENAIKTLEPEEGPELKISKAAQENLTQAASFLTLGVCLIYSSITGPDDVSQLLSPLPISTIDLVCTLAYAATLALLASNSEVTTTFAAFYLMDDRSSLLEQEFGTVSHPFIFALPFRYVALNTFDILGVDFKPFFNVVEKGMLSATTPFLGTYVFNGPVQHNLAEHLAAKLSDFHANSAAELSLIHPVAFNMGWVQKKRRWSRSLGYCTQ